MKRTKDHGSNYFEFPGNGKKNNKKNKRLICIFPLASTKDIFWRISSFFAMSDARALLKGINTQKWGNYEEGKTKL